MTDNHYTADEISAANRTYRRSFGPHPAIVPTRLREMYAPNCGSVLDFGSGTHARYTLELRALGYDVTAHDFGANMGPDIDPDALDRSYDLVFASNVINVQSSERMLVETLGKIRGAMRSIAVMNYPSAPRKAGISSSGLLDILRETFDRVEILPPSGGGEKSALFVRVGIDQ